MKSSYFRRRGFWDSGAPPPDDTGQLPLPIADPQGITGQDGTRPPKPTTRPLAITDPVRRGPVYERTAGRSPSQPTLPMRHGEAVAAWSSRIEPLLTGKEVSRLLGLSHRTLERMRVEGGEDPLPYIKLGKGKRAAVRYRESDVVAWLARHARTSTSER